MRISESWQLSLISEIVDIWETIESGEVVENQQMLDDYYLAFEGDEEFRELMGRENNVE